MVTRKHNHYFKDVSNLKVIDVYRVALLFGVTDPCITHAIKKLLVAGGRGAGKDISQDIKEAIDSLERWQEIQEENKDVTLPPYVFAVSKDTHGAATDSAPKGLYICDRCGRHLVECACPETYK